MYRDDLTALAARHAALETEVAHKTRERDQASQLLDEARGDRRLPVLANIRVAAPCKAAWADMAGDDRVRSCGDCKKHVYNLSAMTRDEAEALIFEKEDRLCVRYYQRADGTVLFGDCWIGAQKKRRLRVSATAAAVALAGTALVSQMATELSKVYDPESQYVMGSMGGGWSTGVMAAEPEPTPREEAVREAVRVIRGHADPAADDDLPPMVLASSAAGEHER